MIESSSPTPPMSTFVVRFWREWIPTEMRWRGRVEHVQSGESATFLHLDGMLDFIRGFGAMTGETRPGREERGTIQKQ